MNLRKKLWLAFALIMIVPVLTNVFVADRLMHRDDSMTGALVYESGYMSGLADVKNELSIVISELGPLKHSEIEEFDTGQKLYDHLYAGVVFIKDEQVFYQSSYFKAHYGDAQLELLLTQTDEIVLVGDMLFVQNKNIVFDDGKPGRVLFGIDTVLLSERSDFYWAGQFVWLSLVTMIIIGIAMTFIVRSVDQSIVRMGVITKKLKNGEIDDPIRYDSNDEFEELADEIEQLRVSLKQSLQRQRQLEEDKRQMIGNISHDLRTPLTAIRGYAQALSDEVAKSEEERDEYLKIIQQKSLVIDNLISDLKVLSDVDEQIVKYTMNTVSMNEFLSDCVEELSYDFDGMNAEIIFSKMQNNCFIHIDVIKFSRVFTNIVQNAIKYNPDGAVRITITSDVKEDHCLISVEDDGVGIDGNAHQLIFERFYRGDKSRNSEIGGSGLGLSICKDIVLAHGGQIKAKKSAIGGLEIEIMLPVVNENN